uniref:Tyrosine-protein phosphatase domain-containing protein n=1 Tax=Caenorhabditis tropicalis TaxID=1561998 RepID=A0A1I7TDL9_9PELO
MSKNNENKIRHAQDAVQKPVRKPSTKKKKASLVAKSPAASPRKKQLKGTSPRGKTASKEKEQKIKTITETEEEEVSERRYVKFIDQIVFIENSISLNMYYLTHLLNLAKSAESFEAFTRNTNKNRNPDVCCIDKTRVKLMDPSIEYYIHANHIRFAQLNRTYIATQHPLPNTLNDFWAMIADQKVESIVSLTHSMNSQESFPIFYPNKTDTVRNFGQFFVRCRTVIPPKTKYGCTEYRLELVIQREKEERFNVRIYHYQYWIKNTVPASPKVILNIVRKLGRKRNQGPIVVQCETGVNQSAEVIYVDAMCSLLSINMDANFDTIFRQLRKQKAESMTQRLHFLHSIFTVLEFVKSRFKLPGAILSQIESIQFAISKDFRYNSSSEPQDELRSPTIDELLDNERN